MKFFTTKYKALKVILDPKAAAVESGIRITKGLNGLGAKLGQPSGLIVEFINGEYDTKSAGMDFNQEMQLIKILKKHPGYGVTFISQDIDIDDPEVSEKKRRVTNEKVELANKVADTNPEAKK